jgi:hypothetical protein
MSQHLSERAKKMHKKPVRIAGLWTYIRIWDFINTKQKC